MPNKLIIVSNRLPVKITKIGGKLSIIPSPGGLATAMSSLSETHDYIWIGWPGISSDELTTQDKHIITAELEKYKCAPVFLNTHQIVNYYQGYSNATIWPLFHYFSSLSEHRVPYWEEYKKVNRLFRTAILKYASSESRIWIHDFHLMILPKLLREALPESSIGFFLHIPFPSYEVYRLLPERKEILEGLLGADLVGFHTYDYAVHFMHSVLRTLGYENKLSTINMKGRVVQADVFPIGIDYRKFAGANKLAEVKAESKLLKKHFSGQRIILSVDRLDYSKGIVKRLEAFDLFLERNPRLHKKVVLVVVAEPSRTEVEAYQDLKEIIEKTVSNINGKYSTVDWSPISYQYKSLPFEKLTALYAEADIAMLTPLRDGMNLIAKEYVATKQKRNGVLIISEMAGVADELPEATRVNPHNKEGIAKALEKALKLASGEQKRRLRAMQSRLSKYTVGRWAEDFVEQLSKASAKQPFRDLDMLSGEIKTEFLEKYTKSSHRLLLFDYDGTLTNFVSNPRHNAATPTPELLAILEKLSASPNNHIVIASGRSMHTLQSWFGDLPVVLAAEHGGWIGEDGLWKSGFDARQNWKPPVMEILETITERTPGSLIEEKKFSLAWHYRNVPPELAYVRKTGMKHDLDKLLTDTEIEVYEGNKVLEIKPKSVTKEVAVSRMLKRTKTKYDFILAIGDDYTDEDMFHALPANAYTVKVGLAPSLAKYHLGSVEDVLNLIDELGNLHYVQDTATVGQTKEDSTSA